MAFKRTHQTVSYYDEETGDYIQYAEDVFLDVTIASLLMRVNAEVDCYEGKEAQTRFLDIKRTLGLPD